MSVQATPKEHLLSPIWTAFLIGFTICCVSTVVAGVVIREIRAYPTKEFVASSIEAIAFTKGPGGASGSHASVAPKPLFVQILRGLAKELPKQVVDQIGHFLIAGIPILLSRLFMGVPWYGWPAIPLLVYREWLQWPSNRWWDPPLDWAVLALGVIVATWALGSLRRPDASRT